MAACLISVLSLLSAAEEFSRISLLRSASSGQFESTARELLHSVADNPSSLSEVAEIYAKIKSVGGTASPETQKLAASTAQSILSAADLAERYTLRDGVSLWRTVLREVSAHDLQPTAAKAIRALAAKMDDAALRDAFFDVSPARQRPAEMNVQQLEAEDLDRVQRMVLFWLLSGLWIERELVKLGESLVPELQCPAFRESVPPEVRKELSPDGLQAWIEAARFGAWLTSQTRPHVPAGNAVGKKEFSNVGMASFESVIDRFFQAPNEVAFDDLSRFYWTSGFWCGNGGEGFAAAQNRMRLMLYLRDRHLPQAVEAMLRESLTMDALRPSPWDSPGTNWRLRLLELCGLDWEKLLGSTLLPFSRQPRPAISCGFAESLLTGRCSTFAAKVLLGVQNERLTLGEHVRADLIARFITPGDVPPGSRPEVAREVQDELLQLLIAHLRRDNNYRSLGSSLITLARLKRPELSREIRSLLQSRFDYVVERASAAMAIMGEDVSLAIRPRLNAHFQIYLNGVPWTAGPESCCVIQYKSRLEGWGISNSITWKHQSEGLAFDYDEVTEAFDRMTEARLVVHRLFSAPLPGVLSRNRGLPRL